MACYLKYFAALTCVVSVIGLRTVVPPLYNNNNNNNNVINNIIIIVAVISMILLFRNFITVRYVRK